MCPTFHTQIKFPPTAKSQLIIYQVDYLKPVYTINDSNSDRFVDFVFQNISVTEPNEANVKVVPMPAFTFGQKSL
jgi:hypothetical protein